jgi:hypothetical protein
MNSHDSLSSWNDGAAKTAILDFVESVAESGDAFVSLEQRVAVFDNDGTLCCEKPLYVHADLVFRRWKAMAEADPESIASRAD